jgi:hypothetical protein
MTEDPNTHSLFSHNSCSRNSLPQLSEQHLQIRNTMDLQNDFDPENIQANANATDAEKLPIIDGSIDGSDSSDDDSDENIDASSASGIASQGTVSNNITAEVRQALKKEDRGVFMWRLFFKIIMIIVAIVLTIATYVQLSRSETRDFTNQVSYSMTCLNSLFSILNAKRSCSVHSILPPV